MIRIVCLVCLLSLVSLLWAALPASDNFTGTEGNAINGNWSLPASVGAKCVYRSNTAGVDSAGNVRGLAWTADTWPNDQYSQATVVGQGAAAGVANGVSVRMATTGSTREWYAGGKENNSFNPRTRIWKYVGGTISSLASAGASQDLAVNDVIKLTVTGTSLELFRNAASILTITDSSHASGKAGIQTMHPTNASASMLDDWSGDQVGGAVDEPPLRRRIILSELIQQLWRALVPSAEAQSTFMQLYVVPIRSFTTSEGLEARVAKYDDLLCAIGCATMDFGLEPVMLVAGEMDLARDAAVTANADVLALPVDLDQALGGAGRNRVQSALEARNLPAGWVTATMTYRQVVRPVAAILLFAQRYHGLTGARLFGSGVTLDTAFGSLPAQVQQNLLRAAESLGYDTSALTASTTLRQALKAMSDQWGARPIRLNGVEL